MLALARQRRRTRWLVQAAACSAVTAASSTTCAPAARGAGPEPFVLRSKRAVSADSWVLTFALPANASLARPAPSGVKVFLADAALGKVLQKSYVGRPSSGVAPS